MTELKTFGVNVGESCAPAISPHGLCVKEQKY